MKKEEKKEVTAQSITDSTDGTMISHGRTERKTGACK